MNARSFVYRAFDKFVEELTANEVDLTGTDREASAVEAEATMKQALLERLKAAEQGRLPAHGPEAARWAGTLGPGVASLARTP
jgi:hypothetical protein